MMKAVHSEKQKFDKNQQKSFRNYVMERIASVHQQAEESEFMDALATGSVSAKSYAESVLLLYFVYKKLEEIALMSSMPEEIRAYVTDIQRAPSLKNDYQLLTDETVEDGFSKKEYSELSRYIQYIDSLKASPLKLLAHLYVRYGGDMAGGRIIKKRLLKQGYDEKMLQFYNLGDKDSVLEKRKLLHELIEAIPESYIDQEEAFVAEVITGFKCNMKLFAKLKK